MQISVQINVGNVLLSTYHQGERISRKYVGYSLSESKRLFRQYVKSLNQLDE